MSDILKNLFPDGKHLALDSGASFCLASNQDIQAYNTTLDKLISSGYEIFTCREDGDNRFATLTCGSVAVNIYFVGCDCEIRATSESFSHLPSRNDADCIQRNATLLTQRRLSNLKNNAGMSYVIRLCDGRFVLIDGGYDEYEEAERLTELLEKQCNAGEKPEIAACFITHSHNDHIGVITRLIRDYQDRITFGDFIYAWPDKNYCRMIDCCEHDEFDALIAGMKTARVIHAHTGQHFSYGDMCFDILFSCDDFYPEKIEPFNNSSLVILAALGERKILFTADAGVAATESLTRRYGEQRLHCDVLQVPHHGYGGGTTALHEAVDPRILLWSAPDYWYREVKNWRHNEYFFRTDKIENLYLSSDGDITLDINRDFAPYPIQLEEKNDILYEADFSTGRIIDLNLTAIISQRSALVGANLRIEDGRCIWENATNATSVIEILKPRDMADAHAFKLIINGEVIHRPDEFGIVFNNPRPTIWDTEKVISPEINGARFSVVLSVDRTNETAYFKQNEGGSINFLPEGECGLYISLKSGEIAIDEIRVLRIK